MFISTAPRASRPRSPSMYLGIIPRRRGRLGRRRLGSGSSLATASAAGSTRVALRTSILIPGLILVRHRHRVLAFRASRFVKINGDRQNGIGMRTICVEGCREKLPWIQLVTCTAAGDLCRKKKTFLSGILNEPEVMTAPGNSGKTRDKGVKSRIVASLTVIN